MRNPLPSQHTATGQRLELEAQQILGRHGFNVSSLDKSTSRSTWTELHETRGAMRKAGAAILDTAKTEDRELTDGEAYAHDLCANVIKTMNEEMDMRISNGNRSPRSPGSLPVGMDDRCHARRRPEGTPLGRDESLADRVASSYPGEQDVSIGAMVRASITGDWGDLGYLRAEQSIGSGSGGGFVTPGLFAARVIDLARNEARIVQAGASVIPVTTGNTTFGTIEEDPTAHWRGENQDIEESSATFGERNFKAKTLAILVRMSLELVEDGQNIDALLERAIAAQIALQIDRAALFGTGIGEPLGIFNHEAATFIDLDAVLSDYAPLSRAVQAVSQANQTAGDFITSARTAGEIDRLTDIDGNPLKAPRSVMERQILATNQVSTDLSFNIGSPPQAAVDTASAVFTGFWPDYYLAVRTDLMLEATRVAGDAFKKMQVLLRGYARVDGFAVRPASFAIVRGITAPAP